ncbi:type VI secretion system baseplate subunit TssF [Mesoterricola silvestris]|uniref:Type VI secretion system protein ImpG n=1 Tax=Mesoterricola silvestris TaxID=2927979 RepID=A0AA48H8H4_9BACT|nr:type VI secretion system baseplate subunit TssF [Mesoterricola silvestris]BDU73728.1 type VI secretion system protein ImpG [Mesoterricola silvestris]
MIDTYYQEELHNLREASAAFARAHPALAPMLGEPSADPDVERLLEGVAFLTGMIRGKLDDDFPEIIHGLMDLVFPHLLLPVPSASILAFRPKPNLRQTLRVEAGTTVASIPVDGTTCRFRTTQPVEVHPLRLTSVETPPRAGRTSRIRLSFQLDGLTLATWRPSELVLHLGESLAEATTLHLLLTRHLEGIQVVPAAGGSVWNLPPSALERVGFDPDEGLLPLPGQTFGGFRLLQDYFVLPQKHLFLALRGWDQWRDRGGGSAFDLVLELGPAPVETPRLRPEHFVLFATPIVNLFKAEAEPVLLDHQQERVRIQAAGYPPDHARVFTVDRVVGYAQGSVNRRAYAPMDTFARGGWDPAVYQVRRGRSQLDGAPETHLSFSYPLDAPGPELETLTVHLTCTNGTLPSRLQVGEICRQTEESSELLDFGNLLAPTLPPEQVLDRNNLWKLLSHLNLNLGSLTRPGNLQGLLTLYAQQGSDRASLPGHLKRIEGLRSLVAEPADLLVRGRMYRGQHLVLEGDPACFASLGDLHLFAAVLERFLAAFSSLNTFTRFTLKEAPLGETTPWPARLGDRPLS